MLARKLTYLCRRGDRYLAVTMDYGNIDRDAETDVVKLDVRELDGDAVVSALVPLRKLPGGAAIASRLVEGGPPTWTIATMSDLKPAASSIQLGRLQWILSTALPMSPAFQLRLNGRLVKSSVERRQVIAEWALGEGEHQLPQSAQRVRDADGPAVEIEGLAGVLRGTARVVTEVLTKNKASEWGRSHGFFVKVRRRLVNLDDPLFGVTALSHASFNRFRLEVNADGLDDFMASTRETIQDSAPVERFRNYLRAEFNHARQKFEDWSEDQNSAKPITDRINDTASSVSRAPLVHAVEMLVSGEVDRLLLIETPTDLGDQTETAFLDALHESLEEDDGEGLITAVELEPLGPDRFIASYDPCTRRVAVNTLHPFFANFIENLSQPQPFQMMAVAEVLSEAYLIEQGYDVADVAAFISRRDAFLRELVSAQREGPGLIAQNLIDNSASENGLEEAVTSAFANIGFTATRLSKAGRPDGFAVATLGVSSDDPEARRDDYSFTYDAKSTAASRVSTHTVGVSTLARHRRDYRADYAVVVAPGFEGGDDNEDSALIKECREHGVTPIRIRDLALLVQIAAARNVGFATLRSWLGKCRTPGESHRWVLALLDEPEQRPPLLEVLTTIANLQATQNNPVTIQTITLAMNMNYQLQLRNNEVRELVTGLRRLTENYLTISGDTVRLEMAVEKVRRKIAQASHEIDPDILRKSFLQPLIDAAED